MPLSPRQAWPLALCATAAMSVSYVDRQALAVLAPTVTRELDIGEAAYGWLLSAFALAYLIGAPLAGRWIDGVGARRGLAMAVLVWSAVAAAHGLVAGFGSLLLLRVLLGLAESPSFPGAAQAIQRALPPADRARGFGILFTGSSFGAMLAPPLASYLAARFDFRFAFVGVAVVGLAWVPLWWWVTARPAVRAALDEAPAKHVASAGDAGDADGPLPLRQLIAHPATVRALMGVLASAPALSFGFNWSAKYLAAAFAVPQSAIGGYLWLPPLLFDAGSLAFGHVASVRANRGASSRPVFATASALAVLTVALPWCDGPWAAVVVTGVAMAGGGGIYALLTAELLTRVPRHSVSAAAGLCASGQSVGHIVSSPLVGWAVASSGGYALPAIVLGTWVVPGALAWLLWRVAEAGAPPQRR